MYPIKKQFYIKRNTLIRIQKKKENFGILFVFYCLLFTVGGYCQSHALTQEDTSAFLMKNGIKRTKIISNLSGTKNELIATLFTVEDTSLCNFGLVSRKNFSGVFSFESIEKMCAQNGEDLVLQVAGAFTPDWKVIEGYALEKGNSVGQDKFFGENDKFSYKGLLIIENGYPQITHLEKIADIEGFIQKARSSKWSLFQQVSAIIDGKPADDIVLPGIVKRRFLVEIKQEKRTKFGIISFIKETSYEHAVKVLLEMPAMNLTVLNALYLDMGSVSEGYFYDYNDTKYLLGDKNDNMDNYTNMLIIYRKAKAQMPAN